jgi:8-oxo-dGTP diphosphatase
LATKAVARAVIFRADRVLLLQRACDQRIAPNAWQCPAGKQEPGEPIETTLIREVREETGLAVRTSVPLGTTSTVVETDGEPTTWLQFDFLTDTDDAEVVLSDEHRDFRWVPLAELELFAELSPQVRTAIRRGVATREAQIRNHPR